VSAYAKMLPVRGDCGRVHKVFHFKLIKGGEKMNKLRWVGLILLLTLLIAPVGLTRNANELKGFENEGVELSISGNVKVRGTPSGHLTVAVDMSPPNRAIQGDGVPDLAFHFVPKRNSSKYQTVALDLEGGTVAFTSRRLTVLSADRHILLNMMLEKRPQHTDAYYNDLSRDVPETVRVSRGKAFGQYRDPIAIEGLWLCGTEGGRCSLVERSGEVRAAYISEEFELEGGGGPHCQGGGPGSTSCSVSCGGSQNFGCSVSCGSGYYSCCQCNGDGCGCRSNQ
jgi:hypothetical protein